MSNNDTPSTNHIIDRINLVKKIHGYQLSQIIAAAVRLKIFEYLSNNPQNYLALAEITNTNQEILLKLLKVLANEEILQEKEEGVFELTQSGQYLTQSNENSLYGMALLHGSQFFWSLWDKLDYTITTGKPISDNFPMLNFPLYMSQNPSEAYLFQEAMLNIEMQEAKELLKSFDFSNFKSVIDIGGGGRYLLTGLLHNNPQTQGIVMSLTDTDKENPIKDESIKRRTQWLPVRSNFFSSNGFDKTLKADLCILRHVARNLNDADLVTLLKNCKKAISKKGKIILIEVLNTHDHRMDDLSIHLLRDLHQRLNLYGIKQRAKEEYYFIATQSQLVVNNILENSTAASIIEFSFE